jgi:myosin heavy subunit
MVEFSEGAMIYQIRNRYKRDKIYTNIGDILISVNPFKLVNLYGKEHFALYKDKLASMKGEPHLFQVASRAYWNLISDKVDQSIIISGESGSGKTESTKLVLKFLSRIAGSGNGVEQQILMSNPILESFGNAKTLRNNNSSRFGKWMEVKFDQFGMICGGKIVNYLLEKSRVVSQINDERNYHAFYQLCAGASLEMRNKYRIMDADKYFYLNQSKCLKIEGFDDEQNFKELMIALRDLKFSEEDISEIIRILACILHIGNMALITPHDDTERTIIKDKVHREFVAELLGIEGDALEKAICYRIIVVRGEEQVVKLKLEQSLEARDSLAKSLYERMFDWLVVRINQFLLQKNSKSSIGILDIFGFEVFQKNSFEQFCINFANEQLQHHFIDYIFTMERNEYKEEKIDVVSSNFVENLDALNLLSAIIDKMDE